jgi:hypothetical protein
MSKLKSYFMARQYKESVVDHALAKALNTPREELLRVKDKTQDDSLIAITTYGDKNFNVRQSLRRHEAILLTHPDLRSLIEDGIKVAYRQPPNLRSILVRSRFCTNPTPPPVWGNFKCPKSCTTCTYMDPQTHFRSTRTSKRYKIRGHQDCESSNVIYLITCERCGIQYVGETRNQLKTRINNHRADIRNEDIYKPVSRHFSDNTHAITDMRVIVIERHNAWDNVQRRVAEATWILELQTLNPLGLNIKER